MKAHLLYADILAANSQSQKAINLLKCCAKVFPPLPFAEIPYTKTLKKAKTLDDLNQASSSAIESSSSYNYTNYRNSQANILSGEYFESFLHDNPASGISQEGELAAKIVAEDPEDISPLERRLSMTERKENKTLSNKLEDNKKNRKMPVNIPKPSNSQAFSVCSDSTFLYKIGKIAVVYRICIEDGLCAIHDFLTLLKFDQSNHKKEKLRLNALFYKAFLLEISFDLPKALEIMRDIKPGLEKLGKKKKVEKLTKFLEKH